MNIFYLGQNIPGNLKILASAISVFCTEKHGQTYP